MSQVYIPRTIEEASQMLAVPGRVAMAGCTNLYVDRYDGRELDKDIVTLHKLTELKNIVQKGDGWHIGSLCTFDQLEHTLANTSLQVLGQAASLVGGPQVRNRGTIGGNIVSASPSADSVPVLMALDAVVCLKSVDGTRQIAIRDFMAGVKKTTIKPNELLTEFIIPEPKCQAFFQKVGTRNALAIAVCNMCVSMKVSEHVIQNISIAIGSCAPTCVRAAATEEALIGKTMPETPEEWKEIKTIITNTLPQSISPIDDIRATRTYREKVAANITYKLVKELWGM